ncbi:MAG TPA: alkyl hydroperoxide reductase subunit F, partial [Oleiagrimonas sp.]|nr:alkyl hydroperoxide reductase subunit F [Oleiagrimonas sp.]
MLNDTLKGQLKAYLEKLTQPIELVASLDDGDKSRELDELLNAIAALSDKVSLRRDDDADARKPSFAIHRTGTDVQVRFA